MKRKTLFGLGAIITAAGALYLGKKIDDEEGDIRINIHCNADNITDIEDSSIYTDEESETDDKGDEINE